jgi:predicted neuraminidase
MNAPEPTGWTRRRFAAALGTAAAGAAANLAAAPAAKTAMVALTPATTPGVKVETICDDPPTLSSHASTICETSEGQILAGWFGGSAERQRDVVIWLSRLEPGGWSTPKMLAAGDEDGPEPWACWNPVFVQSKKGPLIAFYKVGPSPSDWWGRYKISNDGGRSWSRSARNPSGFIGPVRNHPVELPDGTLLCGASEENAGWRVHMERISGFATGRLKWRRTEDLNSAMEYGAIQPALLRWRDGRVQALCRTRQKVLTQIWSDDDGLHWMPMVKTLLPNPNSAVAALVLKEGIGLLVHNPKAEGRDPLVLSASNDGVRWHQVAVLDQGQPELSYPAIIQAGDGLVHITWTWNRTRIRHAVVDPWQLPAMRDIKPIK